MLSWVQFSKQSAIQKRQTTHCKLYNRQRQAYIEANIKMADMPKARHYIGQKTYHFDNFKIFFVSTITHAAKYKFVYKKKECYLI